MSIENAITEWLRVEVSFGSETMTRAQVIQWFEDEGYPRRAAELWLIGEAKSRR